jgi:hypothetical protein
MAGADEAGVLVSGLCAVHCAVLPFLLLLAPTLGVVLTQPIVHQLLAVLAGVSVVCGLFPPAWNGQRRVLAVLGALGGALVCGSAFIGSDACCSLLLGLTDGRTAAGDVSVGGWVSLLATPAGCVLIGLAHVLNRRALPGPIPECSSSCTSSAVATSA